MYVCSQSVIIADVIVHLCYHWQLDWPSNMDMVFDNSRPNSPIYIVRQGKDMLNSQCQRPTLFELPLLLKLPLTQLF